VQKIRKRWGEVRECAVFEDLGKETLASKEWLCKTPRNRPLAGSRLLVGGEILLHDLKEKKSIEKKLRERKEGLNGRAASRSTQVVGRSKTGLPVYRLPEKESPHRSGKGGDGVKEGTEGKATDKELHLP